MPAASADAYKILVDRIQEEFVSLLSTDDLRAIIDRELHDLALKVNNRGQEVKSVLERAIESVLYDALRERVEAILDADDTRNQLTAFITESLQEKLGLK